MRMSLTLRQLVDYLVKQINTFMPDGDKVFANKIMPHIGTIMDRTRSCFSRINNKYFSDTDEVIFNHLHADQYAMFLYFTCNTLYRSEADLKLCTKICQLNKCLHGIDAFYEVELPEIFLFVHPLGTVLGRGTYSDFFLIYQRCGIGANNDVYPIMKEFVTLRPGSSILGDCFVEENCTIAAESLLLDKNLDKNSLYIGNPRDYIIKKNSGILSIWKY